MKRIHRSDCLMLKMLYKLHLEMLTSVVEG